MDMDYFISEPTLPPGLRAFREKLKTHNPKFRRTQERYYSPHHRLFQIAGIAVKDAIKSKAGLDLNILKAITFSALGAEAFLNALGYRTNLEWETFEKRATGEKLEILCIYFNFPFEKTLEPWQALNCLFQLRNDIVHGKPEHLRTEHVMPEVALADSSTKCNTG